MVMPLLFLLIYNPWVVTAANAQGQDRFKLDQRYKITYTLASRLKPVEARTCNYCEENRTKAKLKYLERVLADEASTSYQKEIESMIFTNAEFVNGCWKKANTKGMEFFFTVSESGEASDFAWFPKNRAGKCIKRHISKIEFPGIDKPHHAWLVSAETK